MVDQFTCVWDFDSPLYAAASICDSRYIEVVHRASGRVKEFKNVTQFWGRGKAVGGWLGEQEKEFLKEDFEIRQCVRRNEIPIQKAKDILVKQIENVTSKDFCKELRLVIGGKDNYRFGIFADYKGKRPPKPIVFPELREWLISEYPLIIEDGIEADDVVSIMGRYGYRKAIKSGDYKDDDICLIYIDKDIDQTPGWKWNPKKKLKEPSWWTEDEAAKVFWKQMLQGDTVDNIPGLKGVTKEIWKNYKLKGVRYGIGETNALKLLEDCKDSLDMEQKVLYLYRSYWEQFEDEDWKEHFQMNYQLLKLMERKGVIPEYKFEE